MAYEKIVLKDGTEYENGRCGYSDRYLWCWMKDETFSKVFADFSDPLKTEEIHTFINNHEIIYYGFSEIDMIKRSEYEPGKYSIDVRLTGENLRIEERDIPQNEDVVENGAN